VPAQDQQQQQQETGQMEGQVQVQQQAEAQALLLLLLLLHWVLPRLQHLSVLARCTTLQLLQAQQQQGVQGRYIPPQALQAMLLTNPPGLCQ
jgi:hypothetical protein